MFARCILLAVFLFSADLGAQDFSVNTWMKSQYLGANGAIFEDHPVIQTELSVSHGNCWASVWLSTAGDGWKVRDGDEIDYNASCKWQLNDTATFSLLVAYYDLAMPGGASDLTLTVENDRWYTKLSTYDVYDLPFPGGEIVRVGRKFRFEEVCGWTPSVAVEIAYDFGSFGFEEGAFGKISVATSRAVNAANLSIGVDFSDGITVNDRHGEVAVWIGVSRGF